MIEHSEPVLLIEQAPSLSKVYRSTLERAGLSVDAVFSAREALSTFRKHKNHLVILDLSLIHI